MAVSVAGLLYAVHGDRRRAEWAFKSLAALTFIATGAAAGAFESTYGTLVFVGLLFAAGGDLLMVPKDRRAFLAGLVSFLLGHVWYAVAFGLRGLDLAWLLSAAALAGLIVVPVMRWLWPHVERPMRAPVVAYVLVITTMVALAAGTYGAHGNAWILVGAVAFYLSDLAVARDRFVKKAFLNRAWGLPLYFFAQLVIAGTAGFLS